jgi:hypothetical protein
MDKSEPASDTAALTRHIASIFQHFCSFHTAAQTWFCRKQCRKTAAQKKCNRSKLQ